MRNKSASIVELNPELTVQIKVQVKSMDSLFSSLSRINFIKIDCDGSDAEIILSGRETISKHLPIILFEDMGGYNSAMGDASVRLKVDDYYDEAVNLLKVLGYRIFEVKENFLLESERVPGRITNMLAIPQKTNF